MRENFSPEFDTVSQMIKELTGIYRSAIGKCGISENEFWIWYTLLELEGEFSQQDISAMWSISKQTVNTIISNLVKKELITLHALPGTRNRKVICPTESGLKYGNLMIAPFVAAERKAFNRMDKEEIKACSRAIGHFLTYFSEELA